MATARKASAVDAKIKMLVWGDSGSGKSRFALTAPAPLVIDTEKSTALYGGEFDFWVAEASGAESYVGLVKTILKEFAQGEYPEVKTLVIDNITDVLECLESTLLKSYEEKHLATRDAAGKTVKARQLGDLNAVERAKWYAYRRDYSRMFLDGIKALDRNIIFTGRSRMEWDGTKPTGSKIFDGPEIVPGLMDVVVNLKRDRGGATRAAVQKSRIGRLPEELDVTLGWESIERALGEMARRAA